MTEKKSRFAGIADIRSRLPAEPEVEAAPPAAPAPPQPVPTAAASKMGRPPGKKTDPHYVQVTVYLRKEIHREAKKLLLDDGGQFSDLVDDLVRQWIAKAQTSGSLKD